MVEEIPEAKADNCAEVDSPPLGISSTWAVVCPVRARLRRWHVGYRFSEPRRLPIRRSAASPPRGPTSLVSAACQNVRRGVGPTPATSSERMDNREPRRSDELWPDASGGMYVSDTVPMVTLDSAIKTYAANRAACEETVRVRPDAGVPNLIHVGNRSTGVSASPGTADRVLELLRDAGLDGADRPGAVRALPKIRRLLLDHDPESSARCRSSLPAGRLRVRAGDCGGDRQRAVGARARAIDRRRAQTDAGHRRTMPGSVCMAGVAFLCSSTPGSPRPTCDKDPTAQRSASAVSASVSPLSGREYAGLAAAAELSARGPTSRCSIASRWPAEWLATRPTWFAPARGTARPPGSSFMLGNTAIRWTEPAAADRGTERRGLARLRSPGVRRRRPARHPGRTEDRRAAVGRRAAGDRGDSLRRGKVILGHRVAVVGDGDWAASFVHAIEAQRPSGRRSSPTRPHPSITIA